MLPIADLSPDRMGDSSPLPYQVRMHLSLLAVEQSTLAVTGYAVLPSNQYYPEVDPDRCAGERE